MAQNPNDPTNLTRNWPWNWPTSSLSSWLSPTNRTSTWPGHWSGSWKSTGQGTATDGPGGTKLEEKAGAPHPSSFNVLHKILFLWLWFSHEGVSCLNEKGPMMPNSMFPTLKRVFRVEREEWGPVLLAAAYGFCIMLSYY